jgi:ADP-ribose pyrophosphatase YjhB (NUDIX family)
MPLSGDSQLQTLIQINLYRFRHGQFEYLLLKRIDKDDDSFWQPITEKVSIDGDVAAAVKKAAFEQAGLHGFKHLDKDMYSYEWFAGEERGRDIVFAAEVAAETEIVTDDTRYSAFEWFDYQEALLHLKWDGNKTALRELHERLQAKRISDPGYWSTHEQGIYGSTPAAQATPSNDEILLPPSATAGNNTPKRLPDSPSDSQARKDRDDENPSEWFL